MEGLSHFREDPSEKPRDCHVWNGLTDQPEGVSSSPALPWLARPERLALALEKKWLAETSVVASRIPELPQLLRSLAGEPEQKLLADRILAALEKTTLPSVQRGVIVRWSGSRYWTIFSLPPGPLAPARVLRLSGRVLAREAWWSALGHGADKHNCPLCR